MNPCLTRLFGDAIGSEAPVLDRALDSLLLSPGGPLSGGFVSALVERGLSSPQRTFKQISCALLNAGIRSLLVDFDGCVIPVNGKVHGWVAEQALARAPAFSAFTSGHGAELTLEEAEAAYLGDSAFLKAKFLARAPTLQGFKIAAHGVPWDTLMATNLVGNILTARGASPACAQAIVAEFHLATREVGDELEAGTLTFPTRITPQPLFVPFLEHLSRAGLSLHVVTMTPTSIVRALSREVGASPFIASFQGCDTFSPSEFPGAKATGALWETAARRALGSDYISMRNVGIVEDNKTNMRGAEESGAGALVSLAKASNRVLEAPQNSTTLRLGVMLGGEIASFYKY